jgi:uncharacterized protein Yka (UPF0111/DUF47 family)/predicted small lipoprotein YifL
MNRFSALAAMMLLSLTLSACGAAGTSNMAPEVPQAEFQGSATTKLQPIPLKQGLTAEIPNANPKQVRVKKLAVEIITEANKLTNRYNQSGEVRLLSELDGVLARGLTMVLDVLDEDQDPTSLKAVAAINAAEEECDKLVEAFKKTLFKTESKRVKTVCAILNVRKRAVERVYDLSRLATEE